jgi:anti-sigma regulatory factor (Ser/Thr protein kinase)
MCAAPEQINGYRHEAFFYAGHDEFMEGLAPFVRDGATAGEPVLVVLAEHKLRALREELREHADHVLFADMADVGANPARIIPAWQEFLDLHASRGQRMRGVGEPIWAERSSDELAECERHEALLNVAFADPSFWLLCPYDTTTLPDDVIAEARRNHPFVSDLTGSAHSAEFPGLHALAEPFARPLPDPPSDAVPIAFDAATLADVRSLVARHAGAAGMRDEAASDLALTANELAANSVRYGGGRGRLLLWRERGSVVCEVRDRGHIRDPLVGRVKPAWTREGGRGLWMANQLCDLVQIRAVAHGTAVRVHKRLPSPSAEPAESVGRTSGLGRD